MKRFGMKLMLGLLSIGMLTIFFPQHVMAAGTASGTNIDNSAKLDYQVGGVGQAQISSNTSSFMVDNKVDLTVAAIGNTNVIPGSTSQVLAFSLTNTGNTTQGYSLVFTDGTDDFDMNDVKIFLDVNNDGDLDGNDTPYAHGTRVADVNPDAAIQLLIVANTPSSAIDGQTSVYNLIATTLDAGSNNVTANDSASADIATGVGAVQVVWADAAGTGGDAATDGMHSASAVYTVTSAALLVIKEYAVINDFVSASNFKAIPGALIRYTITVENTGSTDATNVVLVDAQPANTTYVSGSMKLGATTVTDINNDDEADFGVTNSDSMTVNIATLAAGATATITFDVTIN